MRKLEHELFDLLESRNWKPWAKGNTTFCRANPLDEKDRIWHLLLHGNVIAIFNEDDFKPEIPRFISLAGWNTPTTRSRLNALPGVELHVLKGIPYLNGRQINDTVFWKPYTV